MRVHFLYPLKHEISTLFPLWCMYTNSLHSFTLSGFRIKKRRALERSPLVNCVERESVTASLWIQFVSVKGPSSGASEHS
jgi:hypothetical protein